MAIKKITTTAKVMKAKAPKAPKAPRIHGKAYVFYAKNEAAALVDKIKAKGNFSETVLKGLGIEFEPAAK